MADPNDPATALEEVESPEKRGLDQRRFGQLQNDLDDAIGLSSSGGSGGLRKRPNRLLGKLRISLPADKLTEGYGTLYDTARAAR